MIPYIRSLAELAIMAEARGHRKEIDYYKESIKVTEDSAQRKRYLISKEGNDITLPKITNTQRNKWVRRKKAVSDFFDKLDYNDQIPSSYDLTLIGRQNQNSYHDAA
tara:strand:- start:2748 stop:3068 length:321 start_codon:yes stop_codon:yes gene_type:complete